MSDEANSGTEAKRPNISINIPKSAFGPLGKLARLDAASLDKIVAALPQVQAGLSRKKFCERVAAAAGDVDASDVKSIVAEIIRMEYVRHEADLLPAQWAEVVADAVDKIDTGDFELSEQESALLRDRITALFETKSAISVVSKAQSVLTDHEHVFISARLFSDVRPIFSEDAKSLEAAVVVHNLVIHHEENNQHKDFYVSLDEHDIKALREVLDRAEQKVITLRSSLSKAEITPLTPNA